MKGKKNSENVILQKGRVYTVSCYGLTNVMFCHYSHRSACSKRADGEMFEQTATLFVSERKSF